MSSELLERASLHSWSFMDAELGREWIFQSCTSELGEELAERLGLGREAFLPSPCDLEERGCTSSITELVDGSPNPLAASESFELSVPRLGMPCKDEEAAESGSSMMPVGGRSITDALDKLRAPATIADGARMTLAGLQAAYRLVKETT